METERDGSLSLFRLFAFLFMGKAIEWKPGLVATAISTARPSTFLFMGKAIEWKQIRTSTRPPTFRGLPLHGEGDRMETYAAKTVPFWMFGSFLFMGKAIEWKQ